MKSKLPTTEKFEKSILTVRFTGDQINLRGVSIYDLGTTLLEIQRIVNKAHLSIEGRLQKGAYPLKDDRGPISLSIGERRRSSDAFALIPFFTDPTNLAYIKKLADYVMSGIVSYYVGNVLNRIKTEKDEDKKIFIGSIHANMVNIVNRIEASGGVQTIEFGNPASRQSTTTSFDSGKKTYLNELSSEYYLGKTQEIKGRVYRLYPNSKIVTIRRAGGKKVNVYLDDNTFDRIRYNKSIDPVISFKGQPRFLFGTDPGTISQFEAISVKIGNSNDPLH